MRVHEAKPYRGLIPCVLLCLPLLTSVAMGQETLRWKLKKGDELKYSRTLARAMHGKVGDQPLNQSAERVTEVTLMVDAVEAGGTARIRETIDRVRFKEETTSGKVEFDSAVEAEGEGAKLAPDLQPLVGLDFVFRMTPRGEVSDVQLSEAAKKRLADHPRVLPAGKETELLVQLIPSVPLPEQENISVGATWQDTTELVEPRVGMRKITSTYEYTGSHTDGGQSLADIKMSGTAELEPLPNAPAKIEVVKESITGKIHFDTQAGILVERTQRDAVTSRITVEKQTFEQQSENVITTRLLQPGSPGQAKEPHP